MERQEPTLSITEASALGGTEPKAEESATTDGGVESRIKLEEVVPQLQGVTNI